MAANVLLTRTLARKPQACDAEQIIARLEGSGTEVSTNDMFSSSSN